MLDYAKDEAVTEAAYSSGFFEDKKKRSYIDNLGHIHARGADRSWIRESLIEFCEGICACCGLYLNEKHGDMNHLGKGKKRCECYNRRLNDGTFCTGIEWVCTMDPRRGGNGKSCHARKHNREPKLGEASRKGEKHV